MAYQWCSAFSGVAARPRLEWAYMEYSIYLLRGFIEGEFMDVGPGCDLVHRTCRRQRDLNLYVYEDLFLKTLKVGFRPARPHGLHSICLDHTSHRDRKFEVAFSKTYNDEVIADATYAWIADSDCTSISSLARYFAGRVGRPEPFSPRLRQAGIHAISHTQDSRLTVPAPETVRLLNRLEVDVDEVKFYANWKAILVLAIRSPMGFESLSSHNWRLLGKLTFTWRSHGPHVERDMEVMRSLEKAEDWEKLEVWMGIVWTSLSDSGLRESMEDIKQVTLELSLRQSSALQSFENLCKNNELQWGYKGELQRICDRARAERLPLEPPPPPYVFDAPLQRLSVLIPLFFSFSRSIYTQPLIPFPLRGDDTF